ncbi:hypothetical protein [Longimicrobium sp.]|uniref:hypothetical protein n=1 Tax=Longimicrobium sp. TaxID=2029185 RepID=UPI002CBEEE01|nr:hypothetical protein [Longimicrobium sp.]HSU14166.1 hypothetical protein [Longimicrobium sp.]
MSKAERQEIGKCPSCGATIWSDHPYAWCSKCGETLPGEIGARLPSAQVKREEGTSLVVQGRQVPCPICAHDRFWTRKTLMDTRGASFFGIDWANPSAENYICLRCGHVLWFMR